jgi:hypothetical protein
MPNSLAARYFGQRGARVVRGWHPVERLHDLEDENFFVVGLLQVSGSPTFLELNSEPAVSLRIAWQTCAGSVFSSTHRDPKMAHGNDEQHVQYCQYNLMRLNAKELGVSEGLGCILSVSSKQHLSSSRRAIVGIQHADTRRGHESSEGMATVAVSFSIGRLGDLSGGIELRISEGRHHRPIKY